MPKKKISTLIRDQQVESSYKGPIEALVPDLVSKKEGIYIAYDENLFEVIYELAHRLKKEPAQILWDALQKGLFQMIDES